MPLTAAALLAAAALQGAADARPPPKGACIEATQQPDWVPLGDDHRLVVTSGAQRFLVVTDSCPPLHRPFPTVTTELLGGASVCEPHDVRLYVSSAGDVAPLYCSIRSITPISAAEAYRLGAQRR